MSVKLCAGKLELLPNLLLEPGLVLASGFHYSLIILVKSNSDIVDQGYQET